MVPKSSSRSQTKTIFTVGHSTRTLEQFISLLHANAIKAVADVRLIPKSRRYPHFQDINLDIELPRAGIEYLSFNALGGRRRPNKQSSNTGWRSEGFRGYADFMQTASFREGLERLTAAAAKRRLTTMCAEAVPWRCHRSLISDALLINEWTVLDIMTATQSVPHKLTPFAMVDGTTITYPPEEAKPSPTLFDPGSPAGG